MFQALVLPDYETFVRARSLLQSAGFAFEILETPEFCDGLVAPVILASSAATVLSREILQKKVQPSGMFLYRPSGKEIPLASPPDPRWREIFGSIRLNVVRPSLSNPLKLRMEAVPERSIAPLVPFMARLIRGGTYRPDIPLLAFEEEHRLLVVSPEGIAISRADDLLDLWIMLRCMVELILAAWDRRSSLRPDATPRQGVGAIEIFRRLPGRNCGRCGNRNCMEFAVGLFTGRLGTDHCASLLEQSDLACLESLQWIVKTLGLTSVCESSSSSSPRTIDRDSA